MSVTFQLLKFHLVPADLKPVRNDPPDFELMANRFNRLVKELLQGEIHRNTFQPWEVSLLLDLEACRLTRSRRDEVLRRYQKVAQRQVERGELPPIRFADFVGQRARRLAMVPPLDAAKHAPSLNP